MSFTGRIGTDRSRFGNIVLGIVDAFDLPTIGFRAHALSAREVRVLFDRPVTDSALDPAGYVLTGLTPGSVVPPVSGVAFYDADRLSVVVTMSMSLTWQATYSVQVAGVAGFDGEGVTSDASNFTANVPDGARAVGAYLSRRGMVDIVFDRPVGPTATSATAFIKDADGGPGVAMLPVAWSGSGLPEDTLRFVYPVTTPTADSFVIEYGSVVDASNNVGSGSVPLSHRLRSPAPYNSSSLSQMQLLDAHVSEIVPGLNAATLRVYFSGPARAEDVLNPASWNITQPGPHLRPDLVHSILVPDCENLVDCFNFLNAARTEFAAHVLEETIHARVDPSVAEYLLAGIPATDYPTANALYLVIREAFARHSMGPGSVPAHLYAEPEEIPPPPDSEDIPAFIARTNELKALYNRHLAEDRSLPYFDGYPVEIGTILNRASDQTFPVRNELTYFADVHVVTAVQHLPVRVRATIRSEDLGSSTDPLAFSGDIVARSALSPAHRLATEVVLDSSVKVQFDKEVAIADLSSVFVQNGLRGPLGSVQALPSSSLPDATWFYNSLVFAYSQHLSPAPIGAGHTAAESQWFVTPGDYALSTDLPTLISKANVLKFKINGHFRNPSVHTNLDERVTAPDAHDFPSLVHLLSALRSAFIAHNDSGDAAAAGGPAPKRPGRHLTPGTHFLVAGLLTSVSFSFDGMLDGAVHTVRARLEDRKWDVSLGRPTFSPVDLVASFTGFATRPAVASALPRPGLVLHEDREGKFFHSFEADSVEVYFSKRMSRTEINGGTGASISISGGDIVLKRADWIDDRTVSVRVARMEQISYTLDATGLVDSAGNPVT